jgi:DNA invertase Pin-like site-specific DNA recombinase
MWLARIEKPLLLVLLILAGSSLCMVNIPLVPRREGEPLRVLIVGRISTVHQREESIEASFAYVEDRLRDIYKGPIIIRHLGERASGMLAERGTIREAEDLIGAGEVDLVIAEDLGRIFRNPRHQMNFVQDCVDAKVRLICLADNLDTADENWELMLGTAGLRHGLVVTDTRRRVRNNATDSFHRGGMVQKVRFGYRKLTKEEAVSGQFGPPGLRMAKDAAATGVIQQMWELVLSGKTYALVAEWLNRQGVMPGPYAKSGKWTARVVIDVLRDPVLHGERTFRDTTYQRVYRTGKHRRERNQNPEREVYAELAHLTIDEHLELIQFMDARAELRRHSKGEEHPRFRVPRMKAIWPAQHALCSACTELMYAYDRGQLKCSNTFATGSHQCWNHVQVDAERIRAALVPWLWKQLQAVPEARAAFFDACWDIVEKRTTESGREIDVLQKEIRGLEQQADRLAAAIADGGEIAALVRRSANVEAAIAMASQRLTLLRSKANEQPLPVERSTLEHDPVPTLLELARTSFVFGELIRKIVKEVLVVPVQDLMHGQVRARVKVTVEFAAYGLPGVATDPVVRTLVPIGVGVPVAQHQVVDVARSPHELPVRVGL